MKKQILFLLFISLIAVGILTISCGDKKQKYGKDDTRAAGFIPTDTTWKTMTLREKIGQTMILVCRYYDYEKFEGGNLDTFFHRYPVGGFYLPDWYYRYYAPKDSVITYYIRKNIEDYAAHSKYPLIFMEDFERGLGALYPSYTHMPVEMALGAANSEQLAYDYGKSIAMEARDLGINWLLHPVADLNMNPLHSLVNERAISDDAERALPLLIKQMEGMHDQHVISTIKHFPGDGATMRDQHLVTATNNLDWKAWQRTFGKVFQSLIDHGAPSVMVGHITLPAYQKERMNGNLLPATLSKELVTNLLKKEMGFKGVVISDALNMGGASGYYSSELETSIACFEAGTDMMLWPTLAFMDTLEARIVRKEIPMERLDDVVARIWALKERFGLLSGEIKLVDELTAEKKSFVDKTARAVAEKAVTLVRGHEGSLPLDTSFVKTILLVNISHTDKAKLFEYTKKLLEDKGFQVHLQYSLSFFNWTWRMDSLAYYDRIIACFENKYFDPVGIPYFKGIEAESVWTLNMLPKDQVIAISYSNPYYLNFYFQHIPVLINAYSSDVYMQGAVVRALTGEIECRGSSPVKLEHEILQ